MSDENDFDPDKFIMSSCKGMGRKKAMMSIENVCCLQ